MRVIVIDFGGTKVKYGYVDNGNLVEGEAFPIKNHTFGEVRKKVKEEILKLLEGNNLNFSDFAMLGMAMPGIVDTTNKSLLSTPKKYVEAVGFDFVSWGKEEFGLEITIDNDAKLALLGEAYCGAGKGYKDLSLVTYGTGIGTAVLIDGKLLKSRNFTFGNLGGHFASHIGGNECKCGNIGCVEAYASNTSIDGSIREFLGDRLKGSSFDLEEIDYKLVVDLYREGNEVALEVFNYLILHWGNQLVNMVHAYDSDLIILSGGLMNSQEIIIPKLQEYVDRYAWVMTKPKIVGSELPNSSVLLGCYINSQKGE